MNNSRCKREGVVERRMILLEAIRGRQSCDEIIEIGLRGRKSIDVRFTMKHKDVTRCFYETLFSRIVLRRTSYRLQSLINH